MPNQPPLNPDALEAAYAAYAELTVEEWRTRPHSAWRERLMEDVNISVSAYLAVALPEVQANSKPNQNLEFAQPESEDERIPAWHAVANHPAFNDCYEEERPLLESMLDHLTELTAQPEVSSVEEKESNE